MVLSQYVERRHAAELLAGEGGVGYLLKDRIARVDEFLEFVVRVGNGSTAFDQEVVQQLLESSQQESLLSQLSERERVVLGLMAQGHMNASMWERSFITESAVEKHISAIFAKLELAPGPGFNRRVLAILEYLKAE